MVVTATIDLERPVGQVTDFIPWQSQLNGRLFSHVSNTLGELSTLAGDLAYAVLFPLNLVFGNIHASNSILKKINRNILPLIENFRGLYAYKALNDVLGTSVALLDTLQIASGIDYFFNAKFKKDSELMIAGKSFGYIYHAGECLSWIAKEGFINLGTISTKIAEVKIFSLVPRLIACVPIVRDFPLLQNAAQAVGNFRIFGLFASMRLQYAIAGSIALCHFFLAADSYQKITLTENHSQIMFQQIEIAKHAAEFVLAIMTAAIPSNLIGLSIIGTVCVGLELTALIYKERYEGRI